MGEDFWRENHKAWRKEQEEVRAAIQRHQSLLSGLPPTPPEAH
jgi:hypothetical protein